MSKSRLTIGGYESAWLANLVAAYIFEKAAELFNETSCYHGIYRDDRIAVLSGQWTDHDICRWFDTFQLSVWDSVQSRSLKFTCEIWRPTESETKVETYLKDDIKIVESKYFPYLDLECFFSKMGNLRFKVHLKENQELKYLNCESTHTCACI